MHGAGADLPPLPGHARRADRRRHRSATLGAAPAGRARASSAGSPRRLLDARPRRHGAAVFVRAYSLGGGTYTGIEAVSNGLPIMREPRVADRQADDGLHGDLAGGHRRRHPALLPAARRRSPSTGKTMNAVLVEAFAGALAARRPAGRRLVRAGHAGLRGRCCCSSPRRPASSTARASWRTWRSTPGCRTASPRSPTGSTMQNGVLLMGGAALARARLHRRQRRRAGRHVRDQRVPHLLAVACSA